MYDERRWENVPDSDFASKKGLSLRGMLAGCPSKEIEENLMSQEARKSPYKFKENEDGYFDMFIA